MDLFCHSNFHYCFPASGRASARHPLFQASLRLPLQILYLGDLLSSVLVQTIVVIIYSVVTYFFFGVRYTVTLPIVAAFLISILGMYGIGLMIAGLSLYYKRIGAVVLLVQLFLLFVTDTIPTSPVITEVSSVLPLTMCNTVIRNSFVHKDLGMSFLLLCVVSLLWFVAGYVVFDCFMEQAKKKAIFFILICCFCSPFFLRERTGFLFDKRNHFSPFSYPDSEGFISSKIKNRRHFHGHYKL